MIYAAMINGVPTGAVYNKVNDQILQHHAKYGETVELVYGVENVGTEDEPQWQVVAMPESYAPTSISMRQARIVLNREGVLPQVLAAIDTLPEPTRTEALIEWEYATSVDRNSPLVQLLAGNLGLTDQYLDQLFRFAITI